MARTAPLNFVPASNFGGNFTGSASQEQESRPGLDTRAAAGVWAARAGLWVCTGGLSGWATDTHVAVGSAGVAWVGLRHTPSFRVWGARGALAKGGLAEGGGGEGLRQQRPKPWSPQGRNLQGSGRRCWHRCPCAESCCGPLRRACSYDRQLTK